ncbi:MAG: DUF4832 domain-containing protein [Prevotella sp.]|nr:DUF4832 domain-containing protein [Prevotella sp.]
MKFSNINLLSWLLIVMLSCSSLAYCSDNKKIKNKKTVADNSIPGNYIINVEPETQKMLRNPLTGWVLYGSATAKPDFWDKYDNINVPSLGKSVRISDYAHTLYIRISWAILNPAEDVYGWDTDEKLKWMIDNARQRGMRLAFRVVVDSRDKRQDFTPGFVRDAGAKGYESKSGNRMVWSPYPDDPVFQNKYEKFIKAFARKFNDPDIVDFIDGYGLGKWGEAHSVRYEDDSNREAVFKWVVDLYSNNFTKIPLAINYHRLVATPKDWDKPNPYSETLLEYAFNKGYILRHDAFGMTGYYQQWEKDLASKWKYIRPIIMEGGWVTKQHTIALDPREYKSIKEVREGEFYDSKEAHVNMMDFRINETESWFEDTYPLVEEFIAEGGYRLYPDQLSLPKTMKNGTQIKITHRWNNLGWGYCPNNIPQWNYKYKVAFALLDKQTKGVKAIYVDDNSDPSKWLKGTPTSYTFTPYIKDVPKGTYLWAVAIIDMTKNNTKGIDISVKGDITSSGWFTLFEATVK